MPRVILSGDPAKHVIVDAWLASHSLKRPNAPLPPDRAIDVTPAQAEQLAFLELAVPAPRQDRAVVSKAITHEGRPYIVTCKPDISPNALAFELHDAKERQVLASLSMDRNGRMLAAGVDSPTRRVQVFDARQDLLRQLITSHFTAETAQLAPVAAPAMADRPGKGGLKPEHRAGAIARAVPTPAPPPPRPLLREVAGIVHRFFSLR